MDGESLSKKIEMWKEVAHKLLKEKDKQLLEKAEKKFSEVKDFFKSLCDGRKGKFFTVSEIVRDAERSVLMGCLVDNKILLNNVELESVGKLYSYSNEIFKGTEAEKLAKEIIEEYKVSPKKLEEVLEVGGPGYIIESKFHIFRKVEEV